MVDSGEQGRVIPRLLPVLSGFTKLKTLTTMPLQYLGVGFNPPWCGNAYMGEGGQELRRQVKEDEYQANQLVALLIFSTCTQLETLWIGNSNKATLVRSGDAMVLETAVEPGRRHSLCYC